jgi:hypothetical protein
VNGHEKNEIPVTPLRFSRRSKTSHSLSTNPTDTQPSRARYAMGYIHAALVDALSKVVGSPSAVPGTVGWAPTPHAFLWPCIVVDPSDADIPADIQLRFNDRRESRILVKNYLGDGARTDPSEMAPVIIIEEARFVHWGVASVQDLIEFVGALSSCYISSRIAASFLRSVKEAHAASSAAARNALVPPHKFRVGWSDIAGFPPWPSLCISANVAPYFEIAAEVRHGAYRAQLSKAPSCVR